MTDTDAARRWLRTLIWLAGASLLLFTAYRMLLIRPDARQRDAQGRCLLQAHVYTQGEGTGFPRRILGVQNLDPVDWNDVAITISGVGTTGSLAGKPTGDYVLQLPEYDATIGARARREVSLDEFQQGGGPRWVSMSMRVTHAVVTASIGGESCRYETAIPEP
ncbi:MAG: hypothetical protein ACM3SQ_01560 [Betaproteobacteria bacterium]